MGRLAVTVAVIAAVAGLAFVLLPREDDVLVDTAHPRAQQAISVAREIVPGSVVDVRRDRDNGKWEVTIRQEQREYEIELAPGDLALLRVDYD